MSATPETARPPQTAQRPRRADCFLGLHLDHAAPLDAPDLYAHVTDDLVGRLLDASGCDYLQLTVKGPAGVLGYPKARTGPCPEQPAVDALAAYRRVTADRGISLYAGVAGVWDAAACREHPEWAAVPIEGQPPSDVQPASTFGPYASERLIPQLREVLERYGVDGVRIDGDGCVAAADYCDEARRQFRQLTGEDAPARDAGPDDPRWAAWLTLQRNQFFAYLKACVDAVHERAADGRAAEVCCGGLYTTRCPEPVRLRTDFVCAELSPTHAVDAARLEARYLANVGLPWDLAAWSFVPQPGGPLTKPAQQLEQEAAQVLALGGGFELYVPADLQGDVTPQQLQVMHRVGAFCRQRQALCWKSEMLGQVALLLDASSYFTDTAPVYHPGPGAYEPLVGTLHALLEAGHACDVVADHQLNWQQDRYPVIVVPEWAHVPVSLVEELVEYAHRGGSLLVIGAAAATRFAEHLGAELVGEPTEQTAYLQVASDATDFGEPGAVVASGPWQDVRLGEVEASALPLAYRTTSQSPDADRRVAATIAPLGAGQIAAVYGPLGRTHARTHAPWTRDLFDVVLRRLYQPLVEIELDGDVGRLDLVLRRKAGRTLIHLLNVTDAPTGERRPLLERVPEIGPITLRVRLAGKPTRVTLEPEGTVARTQWRSADHTLNVQVPSLHVHTAVAIT